VVVSKASTHVILVSMAEVVKEWLLAEQEDIKISKNKSLVVMNFYFSFLFCGLSLIKPRS